MAVGLSVGYETGPPNGWHQGLPFLKIITCPTSRILKFLDLLIWNKEEKSVQIHLPDWLYYLPWAVGQWETASPEHHPFVIGWSKYCLGLLQLQWIMGSYDRWGFPVFFRGHWQSPCTGLAAGNMPVALQWRHNEPDGISNHQPHDCLLSHLFRHRSKKTSKFCVTGLCVGNSPVTGEFPAQRASNAENVSIWWCHHG